MNTNVIDSFKTDRACITIGDVLYFIICMSLSNTIRVFLFSFILCAQDQKATRIWNFLTNLDLPGNFLHGLSFCTCFFDTWVGDGYKILVVSLNKLAIVKETGLHMVA